MDYAAGRNRPAPRHRGVSPGTDVPAHYRFSSRPHRGRRRYPDRVPPSGQLWHPAMRVRPLSSATLRRTGAGRNAREEHRARHERPRCRAHAYAFYATPHQRAVGAGLMLVGDAAALAYRQSGEGIRPAIESGLLAAETILAAAGQYTANRLEPYEERLRARFGIGSVSSALSGLLPDCVGAALARRLLAAPAFVRHVVLDRWFLHRHQPA